MSKEENVFEQNKLIAEFMGGKYDKDTNFPIHPNDIWLPIHGICNRLNLRYHSSYDWLMAVVTKINTIDDFEFSVTIHTMDCYIENKKGEIVAKCECVNNPDELIKSIYTACLDFIKWYNKQK